MGSPEDEPGRDTDESPRTRVTISRPFWLGRTDVTHRQWKSLMGTDLSAQVRKALEDDTLFTFGPKTRALRDHWGLSRDADAGQRLKNTGENLPMQYVTWAEAMEFCRKLNDRAGSAGTLPNGYRYTLPTEAQWEYACRAGTTGATYGGPMRILGEYNAPVLDPIAWYGASAVWDPAEKDQYPGGTYGPHDVGLKRPNPWGLCDMQGDVYQWCLDWYGPSPGGSATDPDGPDPGSNRVDRGGCWNSTAAHCRSARRDSHAPGVRSNAVGFRLALTPLP